MGWIHRVGQSVIRRAAERQLKGSHDLMTQDGTLQSVRSAGSCPCWSWNMIFSLALRKGVTKHVMGVSVSVQIGPPLMDGTAPLTSVWRDLSVKEHLWKVVSW